MFITKIASLTILLAILSHSGGSNALCRCRRAKGMRSKSPSTVKFYYHNNMDETNANKVPMMGSNGYGNTVVFDDPLTVGPTLNSTVVGRAQGVYTASYDHLGDFFVAWFAFTAFVQSPRLNGSLTLVGAAGGMQQGREKMKMPVRTDAGASNATFMRLFFNIELFY